MIKRNQRKINKIEIRSRSYVNMNVDAATIKSALNSCIYIIYFSKKLINNLIFHINTSKYCVLLYYN